MGNQHFSVWNFSGGILLKSEIPLKRTSHLKYKGYLNYIQQKNVDTRLDSEPFDNENSEELSSSKEKNIFSTQKKPQIESFEKNLNLKNKKKNCHDPQVHPKERLSEEFISKDNIRTTQNYEGKHVYQGNREQANIEGNLIDLSGFSEGKNGIQKIKSNYFERMSKNQSTRNVF